MKSILIKNIKIITCSEKNFECADILIKNGKIADMGENITDIAIDEIIDGEGLVATPGLIDPHCHLGICEEGIGEAGDDTNETTDPITPHLRAIDGINPMDVSFKEAISGGVTTVSTGPGSANILAGSFTIIKTYGKRIDNMIIKKESAIKASFGENPKSVYGGKGNSPKTRMAIASMLRETLFKAREYMKKKEYAEKNGEKVDFNMKYESLIPLLRGEIPLKVHAHRCDDIFTAIRIINEFNLKATLDHCTEGHLIADELIEEGLSFIVGPTLTDKSKIELQNLSFDAVSELHKRGGLVALMTDHPEIPVKYISLCASLCVKHGVSEEDALKMITINPAKILGIDKRVGSIEIGKDGDIAVFTGDPLDVRSRVLYTIINGEIVYRNKQ